MRFNSLLTAKARNRIAMNRHARCSFDRRPSSSLASRPDFQQLSEVAKYNATVNQSAKVGSSILGIQLNDATFASCVRFKACRLGVAGMRAASRDSAMPSGIG